MRTLMILLALCGTSFAADGDSLSQQAMLCWSPAPESPAKAEPIAFDVTLTDRGLVTDLTVIGHSRGDGSALAVQAASRAIQRCGPYDIDQAGEYRVTIPAEDGASDPIDPFKAK